LKESDKNLQARVYGIVARSSSNPKLQLDAYYKAVELLQDYFNRVDYLLEIAQFLCSVGFPKHDAYQVLQSILDDIYEIENELRQDASEQDDEDETVSRSRFSVSSKRSFRSARSSVSGTRVRSPSGSNAPMSPNRKASSVGQGPGSEKGKMLIRRQSSRAMSEKSSGSRVSREQASALPLPLPVTLKQYDNAIKAVAMIAKLESNHEKRLERCLEAVALIQKSIALYEATMQEVHKYIQYVKQQSASKESALPSYEAFTVPPSADLAFPSESILLLHWRPSELHVSYMGLAVERNPLGVPNLQSISTIALTYYYLIWLADTLYELSSPKSALLCLAWLRVLLLTLADSLPSTSELHYPFALIYFKSMKILSECGLGEEAKALPKTLGSTGYESTSLLSLICSWDQSKESGSAGMSGRLSGGGVGNSTLSQSFDKVMTQTNGSRGDGVSDETASVCSIACYTDTVTGFNKIQCAIDICKEWLSLELESASRSAVVVINRECLSINHERGVVETSLLLAEFLKREGQPEQIISLVSGIRTQLAAVGDPRLFSELMAIIVAAYADARKVNEGVQLAVDCIKLLQ